MRLDADLGIDSIKRVEIFSAIRTGYPETPSAGPKKSGPWAPCAKSSRSWANRCRTGSSERSITGFAPNGLGRATDRPDPAGSGRGENGISRRMLELDMRLDADLGIDSIKRVEILSAVQDRLPRHLTLQPEQSGNACDLETDRRVPALPTPALPPPSSAPARIDRGPGPSTRMSRNQSSRREWGCPHRAKENGLPALTDRPGERLTSASRTTRSGRRSPGGQLPAGGTVWITDDGSPLDRSCSLRLAAPGYRPQVIKTEESAAATPSDHLCG